MEGKHCACCEEPDDDGSVAYGCEKCGRLVCGLCLQESEPDGPPVCLDCHEALAGGEGE